MVCVMACMHFICQILFITSCWFSYHINIVQAADCLHMAETAMRSDKRYFWYKIRTCINSRKCEIHNMQELVWTGLSVCSNSELLLLYFIVVYLFLSAGSL